MKSGVLVVGHGSKLRFNRDLVVRMAERLAAMGDLGPTTAAFMEMDEPDIRTGIRKLVEQGVDVIYVQPCFLASGIHITKDIPAEIGLEEGEREARMTVDGRTVVLRYCDPIGDDERIAHILADRVRSRMQMA
jgi:sirohydrochlorin cobaltochelatase